MDMWTILGLVAGTALIIVAVLTATGVLFAKHEREETISPEFEADDHADSKPGTSV